MTVVAFDTETHLIAPGLLAPPLVCASVASGEEARLLDKDQARYTFRYLVKSGAVIVGANIAYDFGIMLADAEQNVGDYEELLTLCVAKYERGEVFDVLIAEGLDAIATGHHALDPRTAGPLRHPNTGKVTKRYSLEVVVDLVLGRKDAKENDFWRKRYALLEGIPMGEWPRDARQYPVDDAVNTREVALAQMGLAPRGDGTTRVSGNSARMAEETRAALGLHLGAIWGMRTDPERVSALERQALDWYRDYASRFRDVGYLARGEHSPRCSDESCDGCKEVGHVVKRAIALAYQVDPSRPCPSCAGSGRRASPKTGKPVWCSGRTFKDDPVCDGTGLDLTSSAVLPRTPTGDIKADRDTLAESGDEQLAAYGDDELEKIRTTYAPFLRRGCAAPLNLRPNVLVSSCRVSYDDVIQQMPRGGPARACVRARDGYYFCSADYSGIELVTLAQSCLWIVGHSEMADYMLKAKKPGILHDKFAATVLGIPLEELIRLKKAEDPLANDARQGAKPANFGFGGGMGVWKFVLTNRKRNAGRTKTRDGALTYDGVRFCVILRGAERCGVRKVTEWRDREGPPTCLACLDAAADLRDLWFQENRAVKEFHGYVGDLVDRGDPILFPDVELERGGLAFNEAANGFFQTRAALGMKRAFWRVLRECYTDRNSPLYGTRIPYTIHDELFAEVPIDRAHAAAHRMAAIMKEAMGELVPDLAEAVEVEPALQMHWLKGAEPYYVNGELRPWEESPKGRKAA